MNFETVPSSLYHEYPSTVAVVGARWKGRTNFMAAAWHTMISFNPPLFGVLISPKRFTHRLILLSGEFTTSFMPYSESRLVELLGRRSGAEIDKVSTFNLQTEESCVIKCPYLKGAAAAYECEVMESRDYGDHTLFVGKIVGVHYDPRAFDEDGRPNYSALLYLGKDAYTTVDLAKKKEYDPKKLQ